MEVESISTSKTVTLEEHVHVATARFAPCFPAGDARLHRGVPIGPAATQDRLETITIAAASP
jgi:hypothetical protein